MWKVLETMNNLMKKLPENLRQVLQKNGIEERHLSHRYSDLYVEGKDLSIGLLHRIMVAGPWRTMSSTFTNNITNKPCLEIHLALLDAFVQEKMKKESASQC